MKNLFLCFLLFPFFVNGQTWDWAHGMGNNGGHNYARGVASDTRGNVYVTGEFPSTIVFGIDTLTTPFTGFIHNAIYLVKYDATGNVLWAKSSKGNFYENDYANAIATDPFGNVYIVGSFFSRQLIFGNDTLTTDSVFNEQSMFIVKYDSLGNALWAKSARATDASFDPSWAEATGVCTDVDGNVYLSGDFYSPWIIFGADTLRNLAPSQGMDDFVVKFNSDGNVLWAKQSLYGSSVNADASKVAVDIAGNVYTAGNFYGTRLVFGSDTIKNLGWEKPFFVKYDATGNVQWAKSTSNNHLCMISSVATDPTGNVILAGVFQDTLVLNEDTLINTSPESWFVAKYDSLGNVLWVKNFNAAGQAYSVVTDGSDNIYVAGTLVDTVMSSVGENLDVVKYSPDGTVLWSVAPDYGFARPASIVKDGSGNNLYIAGTYSDSVQLGSTTLDTFSNLGIQNVFVTKLGIPPLASAPALRRVYDDVFSYPNPALSQLVIRSSNEPITNISINNIAGQNLRSVGYISQHKVTIDISDLPTGIYLLKVNNTVKKFVKE